MDLLQLARAAISSTPPRKKAQVQALFAEWVKGELAAALYNAGEVPSVLEGDRALGRYFARLPSKTTDTLSVQRPASGEADVRRWCWAVGWTLSYDDEDLVLMRDDYVPALLEEAAVGCTKAGEATGIVAHHCRDRVHALLWSHGLHAFLGQVAEWLVLARKTRDAPTIAYLERLVSYGEQRSVSEEEAVQRVFDLRRCDAKRSTPPEIRAERGQWIAKIVHANITPSELFIDQATGAMQANGHTG